MLAPPDQGGFPPLPPLDRAVANLHREPNAFDCGSEGQAAHLQHRACLLDAYDAGTPAIFQSAGHVWGEFLLADVTFIVTGPRAVDVWSDQTGTDNIENDLYWSVACNLEPSADPRLVFDVAINSRGFWSCEAGYTYLDGDYGWLWSEPERHEPPCTRVSILTVFGGPSC